MSAWPSTLFLGNILTRIRYPSSSSELYENFLGFARGFQDKDSGLLYCRLALFRSTQPNLYSLSEFYQTKEGDHQFLTNGKGLTIRKVAALLVDLRRMLEVLRELADAQNAKLVLALRRDCEELVAKLWGASTTRQRRRESTCTRLALSNRYLRMTRKDHRNGSRIARVECVEKTSRQCNCLARHSRHRRNDRMQRVCRMRECSAMAKIEFCLC